MLVLCETGRDNQLHVKSTTKPSKNGWFIIYNGFMFAMRCVFVGPLSDPINRPLKTGCTVILVSINVFE